MNADMKWLDNPEVFRVNQLDAHSDHCYYMDYADMEKSENPLMQSLNGQWEFAFSKNVMDRPENFYEENFDASSFDKIMVPGHIELAGYDKIRYINTMYPWEGKEYHRGAYSMESTGDEAGMFSEAEYNPVGSYIKRFDLSEQMREKKIRICFEGVEEAMYLWLNGQFVGYAEDSFTPSEFDLTPFIREKGNVLAVQVHKMSVRLGGQDIPDAEDLPLYREAHLHSGKRKAVNAVRVILVMGPGVLCQHAPQRLPPLGRNPFQQLRRNLHRQALPCRYSGKAAQRVRVAVGVWDVGLDIQNRRAVH